MSYSHLCIHTRKKSVSFGSSSITGCVLESDEGQRSSASF